MPTYQHILIATDLTPNSLTVLQKAKLIANSLSEKVSLMHVIERDISSEHIFVNQKEYEETITHEAQKALAKLGTEIGVSKNNQIIVIDSPKKAILETAKKRGCDLIIIGSHDRHGLQKLLGSTATDIVHSAKCDVFVIRFNE